MEKKLRQKKKKEQSKAKEDTENEPEVTNVKNLSDSEGLLAQLKSENVEEEPDCQTETKNKAEDSENNQLVEIKPFNWTSEEIRFHDFPEKYDDWSEGHEKDAYSNNFKFYLQKYMKRTIKP